MKIKTTSFKGLLLIEAEPHQDSRGQFARIFCQQELKNALNDKNIAQMNLSETSNKGAIRGMHYQSPPDTETKIIRCLKGKVFDVAIDLRKDSPSFLKWFGIELSATNNLSILIPDGFAHGFQTLEDNCELLYLHTAPYKPAAEGGVRYNDPMINISWPYPPSEISQRDKNHPLISDQFQGLAI